MNRVRLFLTLAVVAAQGCTAPRDTNQSTETVSTVEVPLDSAAAAFYAERAPEYEAERRVITAGPGRVMRQPGVLRITTRSGRIVPFVDAIADPDRHVRYIYTQFFPTLDAHLLREKYYEGWSYRLVNDSTGRTTGLAEVPLVGPEGRRFVVASLDLDAFYNPNTIELWRVSADSLVREFVLDGGELWGPDSVAWVSPDTVRFVRMVPNRGDVSDSYFAHLLLRQNSSWTVQPPIP
jgi:hypothetical protein